MGELDEALALLADEAGGGDEYGDVYSPDWPDRGSTNREEGPFPKWLGVGLLVLTVCLAISLIVHAIFQGGLDIRWKPHRRLMGKPPDTTPFPCQQRSRLTCGFGIALEAARGQSFAVVASGLRVMLRLSFRNGRFRPIGHPNHGRKLLWDKNKNSKP